MCRATASRCLFLSLCRATRIQEGCVCRAGKGFFFRKNLVHRVCQHGPSGCSECAKHALQMETHAPRMRQIQRNKEGQTVGRGHSPGRGRCAQAQPAAPRGGIRSRWRRQPTRALPYSQIRPPPLPTGCGGGGGRPFHWCGRPAQVNSRNARRTVLNMIPRTGPDIVVTNGPSLSKLEKQAI